MQPADASDQSNDNC